MNKLLAILLIFFGETLSIGAELVGSKRIAAYGADWSSVFLPMLVLIILGGGMLVAGYMLGYVYFKNIWIVFALSLGSILVVEPLTAFFLFRELPTTGAAIGLVLGVLGTLAAAFI